MHICIESWKQKVTCLFDALIASGLLLLETDSAFPFVFSLSLLFKRPSSSILEISCFFLPSFGSS